MWFGLAELDGVLYLEEINHQKIPPGHQYG
jgi:hypothetical protein